ncbi:MAG TPA: class I SAM-dependent methyltransferase [Pyrinomonadaceae bacterium]|nr:class I SAM-dependent methyltransferase [Pyrinomonadaceae bacterium]
MKSFAIDLLRGLTRRWRRQRRRQKVGRAYDMALEIASELRPGVRILDVGCGNGFIAHHLASLLHSKVVGLDVGNTTNARIDYVRYDGENFPMADGSFDVILLCYVLHHAVDARLVLKEVNRVLTSGGVVVIYEDIPRAGWDRLVCWSHSRRWQPRTGRCSFRLEAEWYQMFTADYEVVSERPLSRWRNFAHPVSRQRFVLRSKNAKAVEMPQVVGKVPADSPDEICIAA